MEVFLRAAQAITSPWSLAAYAIAAIVYVTAKSLASKRRRRVPSAVWACIVLLVLIPNAVAAYRIWVEERGVYRVRVVVLDPQEVPVENATVWSSIGGEAKKVSGGWQFDIPAAAKPADGKLTVFASVPAAFLTGQAELMLASDYNPTVTVRLRRETSAVVRGIVVDSTGKGLEGASVSVAGYEAEAVTTQTGGHFSLPAHAATGQQVLLHVEKPGYAPANQYHPAGDDPATIVLDRK